MTQEDWSGIGETVEPLSVDSLSESSTAEAADETWHVATCLSTAQYI